jgi:hypothetical protein
MHPASNKLVCSTAEPRELSSVKRPDSLWSPLSLLFNRYWGYFPAGKQPGLDITIYLHALHRLGMSAAVPLLRLCFRGVHIFTFTFTFTMCVLYFSLHLLFEIFFSPMDI